MPKKNKLALIFLQLLTVIFYYVTTPKSTGFNLPALIFYLFLPIWGATRLVRASENDWFAKLVPEKIS